MKNGYGKGFDKDNKKERFGEYASQSMEQAEKKIEETAGDIEAQVKESQEHLTRFVSKIDKQLKEDPWPIVIAVGVGGLLIGTLIGAFKKN
jgi:ElaB/YqjD/DUF883 family membrane-anchored ribosome-binding protein